MLNSIIQTYWRVRINQFQILPALMNIKRQHAKIIMLSYLWFSVLSHPGLKQKIEITNEEDMHT